MSLKKFGIHPYNPDVFTEADLITVPTTDEEPGQNEETIVPVRSLAIRNLY